MGLGYLWPLPTPQEPPEHISPLSFQMGKLRLAVPCLLLSLLGIINSSAVGSKDVGGGLCKGVCAVGGSSKWGGGSEGILRLGSRLPCPLPPRSENKNNNRSYSLSTNYVPGTGPACITTFRSSNNPTGPIVTPLSRRGNRGRKGVGRTGSQS